MIVYLLRVGNYSDELIAGVFTSENKAMEVLANRFAEYGDNYFLEAITLDDENYEDF